MRYANESGGIQKRLFSRRVALAVISRIGRDGIGGRYSY